MGWRSSIARPVQQSRRPLKDKLPPDVWDYQRHSVTRNGHSDWLDSGVWLVLPKRSSRGVDKMNRGEDYA
jgi:hypothetical protein